jgi:hypothetical protein
MTGLKKGSCDEYEREVEGEGEGEGEGEREENADESFLENEEEDDYSGGEMDESFYPDEEEEEEEEEEESDRRRKRVQRKGASERGASRAEMRVGNAEEGEGERSEDEGEAEIDFDLNNQEIEDEHDEEGDSDEEEEEGEEDGQSSDDELYSDQEEEEDDGKAFKSKVSKKGSSGLAVTQKRESEFQNEFQSPGGSEVIAEGERQGEGEKEAEGEGEMELEAEGRGERLTSATFSCMSPGLNICDIYNERAGQRLQGQGRGGLSSSISMNSSLLSNSFKMAKSTTPLAPAFAVSSALQKPYQNYTVKELQQFLKERKLTVSGKILFYYRDVEVYLCVACVYVLVCAFVCVSCVRLCVCLCVCFVEIGSAFLQAITDNSHDLAHCDSCYLQLCMPPF